MPSDLNSELPKAFAPELEFDGPLPVLSNGTMLIALSGWMDGGDVSTGTVKRLMEGRSLTEVARVDSDSFYIFNFPGSMEVATVFRPEVKVKNGVIRRAPKFPRNVFHADVSNNLVFFLGAEPHLRWKAFTEILFSVAKAMGVTRIIFIGSFGGTVPHTREPRMFGSASHTHLIEQLTSQGLRLTDYAGPCSLSTVLLSEAADHAMEMMSFVAEIPGYLSGENPLSIEAVSRRLAKVLNQPLDVDELRKASDLWESKVSEAVEKDEELAATVKKLEDAYDDELIGKAESSES